MGRATNHLTVAQFELLRWVAAGCKNGIYEGSSHRVSARALHNRGLLRVSGSGTTWAVQITADGARRLQEEAQRIEAQRERARREEEARAAREQERQRLHDRAMRLLDDVIAAGGRLDLGAESDAYDIQRLRVLLEGSGICLTSSGWPKNQRAWTLSWD